MRPLPDHRPVDRQPACVWPSAAAAAAAVPPAGGLFFVCPVCWEVLDDTGGRLVHVWWEELVADPDRHPAWSPPGDSAGITAAAGVSGG